ncbi:iron-hydroxamate ABC transporter substrate-binding protein [Paenibacillus sp. L3-i20]|uniref:iron-hydroxamate ABC transporter substrate-binding protein n=1 Tax=Paenibacillus sp. L3-i20 TaxID=2905833 RepID=UPI001EDC9B7E|nr:iron-hydroxamate ABC transporter substrate-binding protein [Paenibacillus sp. L3-i20]GKU79962.1 ABC transporter substrate-binding protein [Paenibacillus sp. L3-i20]
MKKILLPFALILMLLVSACGGANSNDPAKNTTSTAKPSPSDNKTGTFTYESQKGPVVVPANPQRVVVLSSFAGNVMALGVNLVGVDSWSKLNTNYDKYIKDAAEVTDENLEKIIELNPDLIIGLDTIKNIEKIKEIAPTVVFTYGKLDYLSQHVEIGKLLNKEKEAQAWVDDFKQRAQKAGVEIKAKIGADKTISVVESFNKQLYVFGDNWGRGTEILYQEMKLAMPEKVKANALKDGYYAISPEVLPDYMGDYVIMSKYTESDMSFQETESYKNIPAVKNKQVFDVNGNQFYFNDPLTLEIQLNFFIEKLLGK